MNEKKLVHNFKSYLGLETPISKNNSGKNGPIQELKPKLLRGELVVGVAHNVLKFIPLTESGQGCSGSLFVTNYKLSFITTELAMPDDGVCQRHLLLGIHDIALSNISAIWMTESNGPLRRQRLSPLGALPSKVKGLQIVCKNMKVLSFGFKFSPMGQGRTIAVALLHHAFPKRHDLLFAYDYKEPYYSTVANDMNMFERQADWKRETDRLESGNWRISRINGTSDMFMMGACEALVVPASAVDFHLLDTARHFRSGRIPVWVWGRSEGAALLRSGETLPTEQSATAESIILEHVRRSHPTLAAPRILSLTGAPVGASNAQTATSETLPSLSALLNSYRKLMDLFTPPTQRSFWEQDENFLSSLESSRWLRYVSTCLAFADEAAECLADNITVVLQEGDGMDYSAVVSSLVQLLIDPHTRTLSGFQSLVQKEWVSLGHPFCDRLGHLSPVDPREKNTPDPGRQESPVWLLFLDCCHQILRQFPAAFQFTETYLATIWDCSHNQAFDTFIFNCQRDRELAVVKNLIMRTVWDWREQFDEDDIEMFYNPLYVPPPPHIKFGAKSAIRLPGLASSPPAVPDRNSRLAGRQERLQPSFVISALELWMHCYARWLPPLDLVNGGSVQYTVFNKALSKKIRELREMLSSLQTPFTRAKHTNGRASHVPLTEWKEVQRPIVSAFYPFTWNRNKYTANQSVTGVNTSPLDPIQPLDSQSLLNAPD